MGVGGKVVDVIIAITTGLVIGENDILRIGIITVIVALAIYGLVSLFFAVFVVPYQEEVKQERMIKEYKTRDDFTKAESLTLSEVNYGKYAHIRVYNGDKRNTFTGQLWLVKKDHKELPTILELCALVKHYRVSKLEYPPGYSRELELAHTDTHNEGTSAFLAGDPDWIPIESGTYTLVTKLVGTLGSIDIEPKITKWALIVDKENLKVELKKR